MKYKIKNIEQGIEGQNNINLAFYEMPGLSQIVEGSCTEKPLTGARIAGCLHMTTETAVLINALTDLGADVRWCSSNRFSTCDAAAAAIVENGVPVFAWYGQSEEEFAWCKEQVLKGDPNWTPNMILDDGAELTSYLSEKHPEMWEGIRGITEETTSGLFELNKLEKMGKLYSPAIVVNNSITKSKFDNIYGCHESLVDALKAATGMLLAGKVATVIGYGDVGKGCCRALRGNGMRVQVVEVDPISALQASMDGFEVVNMDHACSNSHIFVTATGNRHVIDTKHFKLMRDRAVLCNMGNFNDEIDVETLNTLPRTELTTTLSSYKVSRDKSIFLVGNGAPANLACVGGHSSFVMSTSFSNQLLAQIELWCRAEDYAPGVHSIPRTLDEQVARYHLEHLGAKLSVLSEEQAQFIGVSTDGPFKPDFYRY
ncbi:adenosylhomocysteinase [Vibrio sp. Isolate23]|uniref:adenosylhomocysteinase n=1 Tax=Vibrio sp. Isolate23 TaxID=2908533 RepID=UPI001EFC85B3|nr:adenosylhomocysteinase [Vibrio sp. Isolate23]MCG9681726.1 adenosylhomocysteinase [Vibrio sp. Isolate23]